MTFILAALTLVGSAKPNFRVVVLYENGGHHIAYSKRAQIWLDDLAAKSRFSIDYINTPDQVDSDFLSRYQLFIQLDYPPYGWPEKAARAFESYVQEGKGGWIGLHHASLLGEFDGFPMWDWFSNFMGGIRWKNYIPTFAKGTVHVEDRTHPVIKGVAKAFTIQKEEWYTYDKDPRPNVHVLASVDESSYVPGSEITMGDHPVVWTNPSVRARNVYIFMGHDPILFDDKAYKTMFRNAIFWAASK